MGHTASLPWRSEPLEFAPTSLEPSALVVQINDVAYSKADLLYAHGHAEDHIEDFASRL